VEVEVARLVMDPETQVVQVEGEVFTLEHQVTVVHAEPHVKEVKVEHPIRLLVPEQMVLEEAVVEAQVESEAMPQGQDLIQQQELVALVRM
tara:strand:+ start:335 stop:607 length:273 start_codon:yes stop_codon:yes gene_type:complete